MPESVAGTRWERCRVKVEAQPKGRYPGKKTGQAIGGWNREQLGNAQYIDCPGCPRCEAHGGYVLRRGSWRHTRAHEMVLHLTKGMGYFSDQEAVREKYIDGIGNDRLGSPWVLDAPEGTRNDGGRMRSQYYEHSGRNPRSVLSHSEVLVTLREDLSTEDRDYVISELQRRGLV